MPKRGEGNVQGVLNLLVIVVVGIVVIWYLGEIGDISTSRITKTNLDIIESAVNLACLYDHMNVTGVQLTEMEGNISIEGYEVCINPVGSVTMCREVLCRSLSPHDFNLDSENRLDIIKDNRGWEVEIA